MQNTLTHRFLPVDFLTSNHYIFGQLKVSNTGLMGLLSDPTSSYIEVNDASIARILKSDKVINYSPTMWLPKNQVVAACMKKRDYIGGQSLVRGGFTRIVPLRVQIITPIYEIEGTLEWAGRFEFSLLMSEGTNAFFALYDAVLAATLFPTLRIESQAMLINRSFMDALMLVRRGTGQLTGPPSLGAPQNPET